MAQSVFPFNFKTVVHSNALEPLSYHRLKWELEDFQTDLQEAKRNLTEMVIILGAINHDRLIV